MPKPHPITCPECKQDTLRWLINGVGMDGRVPVPDNCAECGSPLREPGFSFLKSLSGIWERQEVCHACFPAVRAKRAPHGHLYFDWHAGFGHTWQQFNFYCGQTRIWEPFVRIHAGNTWKTDVNCYWRELPSRRLFQPAAAAPSLLTRVMQAIGAAL